ncbi:MAG: prepilin-type N-terminal cleavage/methylation domain-containing protein [Candidatus Doudnabacteria bacterium]|nr:prepilin-type N-terminal cleavage/methylation domain-containing protein [Candidatus Doudnabacteria bacterium]
MNHKAKKNGRLHALSLTLNNDKRGFTLMEVIVATTIFAVVVVAMMALFNYTLKINRKAEALRQVTQGVRNFTEFVVKTVRNGQIDYAVKSDLSGVNTQVGPCPVPSGLGNDTYGQRENRLGLITEENERWCLFLGDAAGNWVANGYIGETLVLQKESGPKQILNPPNFKIENLMFMIRPFEDPYYTGGGGLIRTQPLVTVIMKVVVTLPTGEKQTIYYQTSVSSDKYDIPNN